MNLFQLLEQEVTEQPTRNAVLCLGGSPLSYSQFFEHVCSVGAALRAHGYRQDSCVAIVLPNGPEMATAFLAVSTWTVSAPLNPAYGAREFEFYLSYLKAEALIVEQGSESPAVRVARDMGIAVLELKPDPDGTAGSFLWGIPMPHGLRENEKGRCRRASVRTVLLRLVAPLGHETDGEAFSCAGHRGLRHD